MLPVHLHLNKVKAAPILISKKIIEKRNKVNAILVNSGNANACTGEQGHNDALNFRTIAAAKLGVKPDEVLVSSTGVIGQLHSSRYNKRGDK